MDRRTDRCWLRIYTLCGNETSPSACYMHFRLIQRCNALLFYRYIYIWVYWVEESLMIMESTIFCQSVSQAKKDLKDHKEFIYSLKTFDLFFHHRFTSQFILSPTTMSSAKPCCLCVLVYLPLRPVFRSNCPSSLLDCLCSTTFASLLSYLSICMFLSFQLTLIFAWIQVRLKGDHSCT